MRNEFTAVIERDGDWYIGYCPVIPGAVGWKLTPAQVARLNAASAVTLAYPYWHQRGFTERNPPPV